MLMAVLRSPRGPYRHSCTPHYIAVCMMGAAAGGAAPGRMTALGTGLGLGLLLSLVVPASPGEVSTQLRFHRPVLLGVSNTPWHSSKRKFHGMADYFTLGEGQQVVGFQDDELSLTAGQSWE
eukprot:COSAG05_NODE_6903_length_884_cov_1.498089_1_plen_121_part_10